MKELSNRRKFSERMGYNPIRDKIQIGSINIELRTKLWNIIFAFCFNFIPLIEDLKFTRGQWIYLQLWKDFLNEPIDDMPSLVYEANRLLHDLYFELKWFRVYDLIEFIYAMQRTHALSNIELTKVSDRKVVIRINNCPAVRRFREVVEKTGLDIDPRFMCEVETRTLPEVIKGFGIDLSLDLEENGCLFNAKLK